MPLGLAGDVVTLDVLAKLDPRQRPSVRTAASFVPQANDAALV
jgi:hypothetical protein